jgi:hypothetical protein
VSKENIIKRIFEAGGGGSYKSIFHMRAQHEDFEKVRKIINSVENKEQLKVAVKTVNNFITKHRVGEHEPQYSYLERMIDIKKKQYGVGKVKKTLKKLRGDDTDDLSERFNLGKIIREEVEDFELNKKSEDEEDVIDEDSMWGDDENWGTDKSHWDNDPLWGSTGGGYTGGDTGEE